MPETTTKKVTPAKTKTDPAENPFVRDCVGTLHTLLHLSSDPSSRLKIAPEDCAVVAVKTTRKLYSELGIEITTK